jgi:small conductance mechanosensitive channel
MQATDGLNREILRILGLNPPGSGAIDWPGVGLTIGEGILVLIVTYLVARLARHLSRRASRNAQWDVQLVLLVGRIVYLGVLALGLLSFIKVVAPGYLGPTIGALGLLGLAFGLAFQDVLKSWISGFFLLLERPFRIGDEINISQWQGTVESVLMRVTVLRSTDGEKIQVPNQQVFTSAIVNRSSYPTRRLVSTARIADGVELKELLGRGMKEIRRVSGIATDPAPKVALVPRADIGPSIEASYWIDYHREDAGRVKSEVDARLAHVAAGGALEDEADLAVVARKAVGGPGKKE